MNDFDSKGEQAKARPEHLRSAREAPLQRKSPANPVLSSSIGNQGVQDLLVPRRVQAKLTISDPADSEEREADRIADAVMRMPERAATDEVEVQRQCEDCQQQLLRQPLEEEEEQNGAPGGDAGRLRRRLADEQEASAMLRADNEREAAAAGPDLEGSIAALDQRGKPLPESVRNFMEPRFKADFSGVRAHDDAQGHELARAVGAQAFTVGHNVVFGAGYYAPFTPAGQWLLAHELTHVVQQGAAGAADLQRQAQPPAEAAPTTDPDIEALDLQAVAKAAAYELKKKRPSITFTSGRRSIADQASAMAANIVAGDRKWIESTYSSTSASRALQKWVDDHPEATTASALAAGLEEVFNTLTDAQKGYVTKHITGEAFDVQPQTQDAAAIKADIQGLTGITKFLDTEGGLVRWHAQFKPIAGAAIPPQVRFVVQRQAQPAITSSPPEQSPTPCTAV